MKKILVILLISSITQLNMSAQSNRLIDRLSEIPEGWNAEGEPKVYNPTQLYDYINGGAELYISYGMGMVISQLIKNAQGDEIRIEIFDMLEARNAFGVFTHTRTKDEKKYGQGSQYFTGAQIFWKDHFFVSIVANDENETIISTIESLAKEIEDKISSKGLPPEILNLLPQDNLVPDGYIYFHHYIWLNAYQFISNENILNLSHQNDAVLAKYGEKENRHYLLLITYPSNKDALIALKSFLKEFEQESNKEGIWQEEQKWNGAKVSDHLFIGVFSANSKKAIQNIFTSF